MLARPVVHSMEALGRRGLLHIEHTQVFPNSAHVRRRIQSHLGDHFGLAKRALRLWLRRENSYRISTSEKSRRILTAILSLNVSVCRHFSSAIEHCKIGEGAAASMLARSMFEANLATRFILAQRFTPRTFDRKGKATRRIIDPKARLTREFRVALYVADAALAESRFAGKHATRPGLIRAARIMGKRVDAAFLKALENEIGSKWMEHLRKRPGQYAGVSTTDLARCFGRDFQKWHHLTFPYHSAIVHSMAPLEFMKTGNEDRIYAKWYTAPSELQMALECVLEMFLLNIGMFAKRYDLGTATTTAVHEFAVEYRALAKRPSLPGDEW